MQTTITKITKGQEGVALPEDYLRELELVPGSEVEVLVDKGKRWIVLRPLDGDDFRKHFKESWEQLA